MKPRFNSLDEWLSWQESLHWAEIDMGNERLRQVAERMSLLDLSFTVITVGGTNGKGSTVSMLDAILCAQGYKTGASTSPFLYRYNERIQLSGEEASDELICNAFQAIDEARGDISLTYFEFATLAAIWVFQNQGVDVAIMEVGMGGRLDAVNLWDADAAIITSVGIDHVQWLGDNREDIGHEKAGIMRSGKPVVIGDLDPPESLKHWADKIHAKLYQAGKDFSWQLHETHWTLNFADRYWDDLPLPALKGSFQVNNAAVAITVLATLGEQLNISEAAIHQGLKAARLAGRLECVQQEPEVVLDVAHNSHAAVQLAQWLRGNPVAGKTYALFSILNDKDIDKVVEIMAPMIDYWFVSTVNDPRAMVVDELVQTMSKTLSIDITACKSIEIGWNKCKKTAKSSDRIVVFGSFLVLSEFKVIF